MINKLLHKKLKNIEKIKTYISALRVKENIDFNNNLKN